MKEKSRVVVFMPNEEGDLPKEFLKPKEIMENEISNEHFSVKVFHDKNKKDLIDVLYDSKPDIVIFYAHGEIKQIQLGSERMSEDKLLVAFQPRYFLHRPKLIILSSCHSDQMAKELFVKTDIPTIGCIDKILGDAATKFIVKFINEFQHRDQTLPTAFLNALSFIAMEDNNHISSESKKIILHHIQKQEYSLQTICTAVVPSLPSEQLKLINQFDPKETSYGACIIKLDNNIKSSCQNKSKLGKEMKTYRWYLRWTRRTPQNHIVLSYFNGIYMVERDYCLDENNFWRLCIACNEEQVESPKKVGDFRKFLTQELTALNKILDGYDLNEGNLLPAKYHGPAMRK